MGRKLQSVLDADVIVVGGGHAGVEAALAVARMGRTAILLTMEPTKLALMSCNPSVGGPGKSHVVKEIDALGGLMGEAADATGIQFRRLNLSKGPAVWAIRAQVGRVDYCRYVTEAVGSVDQISVVKGTAAQVLVSGGKAVGVRTEDGENLTGRAVILATGTFLNGLIYIGSKKINGGRRGESASCLLSESLNELGFEIGRLKTGTPPRLDGKTVDWAQCRIQPGDEPVPFFSDSTKRNSFEQTPCYLTQTTDATKAVITANMALSPMFSGQIDSAGPRYCPSIEAKYHRFKDKQTHLIFLEPEGRVTQEVYPNGFSTGLPEAVQLEAIRTVPGLEEAVITQPGYAIEYDYCPAYQVTASLQTKRVNGLYFAGQINGTSGYEEAAGQGLMAGANAVLEMSGEQPLILDRSQAYIGVMVDDLVTRSTTEPYRLFTSRAEYRLLLREDNARDRLSATAARLGLVGQQVHEQQVQKQAEIDQLIQRLGKERIAVDELGKLGDRFKKSRVISLRTLLKQPRVTVNDVLPLLRKHFSDLTKDIEVLRRAAITIYYEGYIERQEREIKRFRNLELCAIPSDFDHTKVPSLKNEAREKLVRFKPSSLGQASRIEGVTPGDIAVLSVFLQRYKVGR